MPTCNLPSSKHCEHGPTCRTRRAFEQNRVSDLYGQKMSHADRWGFLSVCFLFAACAVVIALQVGWPILVIAVICWAACLTVSRHLVWKRR